ncbi:MAG: hypothetical protein LUH06_06550, partial [Oscillospiraceae bacterium]|nr:hypothetical protein [Oscillospiraceae bacterium]
SLRTRRSRTEGCTVIFTSRLIFCRVYFAFFYKKALRRLFEIDKWGNFVYDIFTILFSTACRYGLEPSVRSLTAGFGRNVGDWQTF